MLPECIEICSNSLNGTVSGKWIFHLHIALTELKVINALLLIYADRLFSCDGKV